MRDLRVIDDRIQYFNVSKGMWKKFTFWVYLKDNMVMVIIWFTILLGIGFPSYWYYNGTLGLDSSLTWVYSVLGVVWAVFLIGNYISYRRFTKQILL